MYMFRIAKVNLVNKAINNQTPSYTLMTSVWQNNLNATLIWVPAHFGWVENEVTQGRTGSWGGK